MIANHALLFIELAVSAAVAWFLVHAYLRRLRLIERARRPEGLEFDQTRQSLPPQHSCSLPAIETWRDDPEATADEWCPPKLMNRLDVGTRFHCECGITYVVTRFPAGENQNVAWTERYEWTIETRSQRFRRSRRYLQ